MKNRGKYYYVGIRVDCAIVYATSKRDAIQALESELIFGYTLRDFKGIGLPGTAFLAPDTCRIRLYVSRNVAQIPCLRVINYVRCHSAGGQMIFTQNQRRTGENG
jgi:hypothetical protein